MDESAISLIQRTAVTAVGGVELPTDIPARILPDGYNIHNLEKYQNQPSRFRGIFSTNQIDDFVQYCVGTQKPVRCFIDQKDMKAKAYFDLGDPDKPGHGEHTALLSLERKAAFKALLELHQEEMDQKKAAEFFEDWRDCILLYDENEKTIDVKQGIMAIRKLTINAIAEAQHVHEDKRTEKSTLERIEAQNLRTFVNYFVFNCQPYGPQLGNYLFTVRVSLVFDRDRPRLRFNIIRLEDRKETMANDFRVELDGALDVKVEQQNILIGAFAKQP